MKLFFYYFEKDGTNAIIFSICVLMQLFFNFAFKQILKQGNFKDKNFKIIYEIHKAVFEKILQGLRDFLGSPRTLQILKISADFNGFEISMDFKWLSKILKKVREF